MTKINRKIKKYLEDTKVLFEIITAVNKGNIVIEELTPGIKRRLNSVYECVSTMKIIDPKENITDYSKCTYDVMYSNGKIELGLHASSKESLISILTNCDPNEKIQILRVIDSSGKIIESNEPHWINSIYTSTNMHAQFKDEKTQDCANLKETQKNIVDDTNKQEKNNKKIKKEKKNGKNPRKSRTKH